MSVSDQLSGAIFESEVYVDENGYAHDDEGNRWFVGKGFAPGDYRPREVPLPSSPQRSRWERPEPSSRPIVDNSKRIAAFEKLPERQRTGTFGASILRQLQAGKALTEKQKSAVRQMFYRASLRDLADAFR